MGTTASTSNDVDVMNGKASCRLECIHEYNRARRISLAHHHIDSLMLVVTLVCGLTTAVVALYGQFVKKDGGNYFMLVTAVLSVLDLVTDVLYTMQAFADFQDTDRFWIPVVFTLTLVVTAMVSIPILAKFLIYELKRVEFKDWFLHNRVTLFLVCLL